MDLYDLITAPPALPPREVPASALPIIVRSGRGNCDAATRWRKAQDRVAKEERKKRKREKRKEKGLVKKARLARDLLAGSRIVEDEEGGEDEEPMGQKRRVESDADEESSVSKRRKVDLAQPPPSPQPQAMSPPRPPTPPPPPSAVHASPAFMREKVGYVMREVINW